MNTPDKQTSNHSDLLWDAFRYVADEMLSDEVDAFELLLSRDQSAREAVVRAVQVTQAVASVEDDALAEPVHAIAPRNSSTRVLAAVLSVCLLLMAGLYFGDTFDFQPSEEDVEFSTEGAGHLVAIWSDSEDALDTLTDAGVVAEGEREEPDQLAMIDYDEQLAGEYDVPGWMLTGVAYQLEESQQSPNTQLEGK